MIILLNLVVHHEYLVVTSVQYRPHGTLVRYVKYIAIVLDLASISILTNGNVALLFMSLLTPPFDGQSDIMMLIAKSISELTLISVYLRGQSLFLGTVL